MVCPGIEPRPPGCKAGNKCLSNGLAVLILWNCGCVLYVWICRMSQYFGDALHLMTHINVSCKNCMLLYCLGMVQVLITYLFLFLDFQSKDGWQDVSSLKKSHNDKIHVICIIVYIFSCVIGYWLTSRSKMLVYVSVYIDTRYLSYSLCNSWSIDQNTMCASWQHSCFIFYIIKFLKLHIFGMNLISRSPCRLCIFRSMVQLLLNCKYYSHNLTFVKYI